MSAVARNTDARKSLKQVGQCSGLAQFDGWMIQYVKYQARSNGVQIATSCGHDNFRPNDPAREKVASHLAIFFFAGVAGASCA